MTYDKTTLLQAARQARAHAYAPYSGFAVGAALLDAEGTIHQGCNVENISFGLTLCAERGAVMAALLQARRLWVALAIVADSEIPLSPCGACRQVLAEFSSDLIIVSGTMEGRVEELSLATLLPRSKTGILNHGGQRTGHPVAPDSR